MFCEHRRRCEGKAAFKSARGGAKQLFALFFVPRGRLPAVRGRQYVVGCNVENSAFSSTVCAERTAFVQAVAAGKREFKAIAVVSPDSDGLCLPCGECRQVMSEFCAEDFLILSESGGETAEFSLGGLLPRSFKLKKGN